MEAGRQRLVAKCGRVLVGGLRAVAHRDRLETGCVRQNADRGRAFTRRDGAGADGGRLKTVRQRIVADRRCIRAGRICVRADRSGFIAGTGAVGFRILAARQVTRIGRRRAARVLRSHSAREFADLLCLCGGRHGQRHAGGTG